MLICEWHHGLHQAELQLGYPNTLKAVHNEIAFKSVIAQYKHRLHSYADQGFFTQRCDSPTKAATMALPPIVRKTSRPMVASPLTLCRCRATQTHKRSVG